MQDFRSVMEKMVVFLI